MFVVVVITNAYNLIDGVDAFAGSLGVVSSIAFGISAILMNQTEITLVSFTLAGSLLGFISGVVGIGGGIFLSPILFLLRAGKPQQIVTTASIFILINSVSGIIGQLTKNAVFNEISNYWVLLLAVIIGGQLGNFLNLKLFSTKILALLTAVLVIFVAIRMGLKLAAFE